MATNFPTSIDSFTNPTGTDQVGVDVGTRTHSEFHSDNNDAIEAIQTKLGYGASDQTAASGKLLRGTGAGETAWDKDAPTGTIVGTTDSQTLQNKTIDNTNTIVVKDANFTIQDDGDTTKQVQFQASGITTATTRTKTLQDVSGTLYESGGTDVAIADGGTGASTATAGFDNLAPTTTKGDIIVHNGTDNIRLAVGADNTVVVADSAQTAGVKWATLGTISTGKLAINTSDVAVASTTAETSLFSFTLTGGVLSTGNIVSGKIFWNNGNSTNTATLRLKYGATTIASVDVQYLIFDTGTYENYYGGVIDFTLMASGATNTQVGVLEMDNGLRETSSTVNPLASKLQAIGTGAEDSTTNLTVDVTIQFATSGATDKITKKYGYALAIR